MAKCEVDYVLKEAVSGSGVSSEESSQELQTIFVFLFYCCALPSPFTIVGYCDVFIQIQKQEMLRERLQQGAVTVLVLHSVSVTNSEIQCIITKYQHDY